MILRGPASVAERLGLDRLRTSLPIGVFDELHKHVKWKSFLSKKPRGRGPGPQRFIDHWPEMLQCLELRPDQTAAELLTEFQARYPGCYSRSHLRTLRRRLQVWRREAIQRLISKMQDHTQDVGSGATG